MNPDDLTRRSALIAATTLAVAGSASAQEEPETKRAPALAPGEAARMDREAVMGAGMTEAEAKCWALIAEAAGAFFELPELHPMDRQEVASAIHIVQNKLLSRPTYRAYTERAKAAYEARKSQGAAKP